MAVKIVLKEITFYLRSGVDFVADWRLMEEVFVVCAITIPKRSLNGKCFFIYSLFFLRI